VVAVASAVAATARLQQEAPSPAFDKVPFDAQDVWCALWDRESDAALLSTRTTLQAG
jgi:hypothetical protein